MLENEIRPYTTMQGARRSALKDLARLISRIDDFVESNCPACESHEKNYKYIKNGLSYSSCVKCDTFYMDPRPSEDILEWFYKDSENYKYWNEHIFPQTDIVRKEKIFTPRVDKLIYYLNKYNVTSNSLLEIGCAFGTFLELVNNTGKFDRVTGVEPTPGLAATCRSKGIEVIEETVENIKLEEQEKYSVVANFEVLEHLGNPISFIKKCRSFLKPDGILIFTCPNGKGFDFEILGSDCNSVDHEHLNYFNPYSIKILLKNCGFEVLEVQTPGLLDVELVKNKIQETSKTYNISNWLKNIINNQTVELQEFLQNNLLSSSLWVVARVKN